MLDELTPRHEEDTEMRRAELKELSLHQLIELQSYIGDLITEKTAENRKTGMERIKKIAADLGCTVEELFLVSPKKGGRAAPKVKYRFPNGATWTGLGRMPKAAKEYLDGVDTDDKDASDDALAKYMVE